MTDTITLLQDLGFTEKEARAYRALLQHDPVSGYELAKVSGILRPNIYPVLQKLEARGVSTTSFRPPWWRLGLGCSSWPNPQRPLISATRRATPPARTGPPPGRQQHAGLLIALWPDEARALSPELTAAEERGHMLATLLGGLPPGVRRLPGPRLPQQGRRNPWRSSATRAMPPTCWNMRWRLISRLAIRMRWAGTFVLWVWFCGATTTVPRKSFHCTRKAFPSRLLSIGPQESVNPCTPTVCPSPQ